MRPDLAGGKPIRMADLGARKPLTTRDAADCLGVNIQKFFRLAAKHNVQPVLQATGRRGARFWDLSDVARLAILLALDVDAEEAS